MDIEIPEYLYDYPDTAVECVTANNNVDGFTLFGRNPNQTTQWRSQTYKLVNGKLYASGRGSYGSSMYIGQCIPAGEMIYKPEYKEVIFPAMSIIIFSCIGLLAYRLILHPWWRKRV